MKLSIIVLNYKNANLVKYFLRTVTSFVFDFAWEVIVVDNNSRDGLAEIIKREFSKVRSSSKFAARVKFVANKKNAGMGAGNNAGIRESQGQYILVANPDVTLNAQAIETMIHFFESHPQAGIVGPRINNPDGTRQETCFHWPQFSTFLYRRTCLGQTKKGEEHLRYYTYKNQDLSKPRQVDWVLGGCFMIRRRTIDAIGLFDEKFFLFLEDTDLCRRVWQAGNEVWYLPEATVIHLPHRLSAGEGSIRDIFSRLTWIHLMSWLRYFWKWRKKALV